MTRRGCYGLASGIVVLVAALWAVLSAPPAPPKVPVSAALGADPTLDAGYARALAPRPFRFPEDHGPHPEFRTEWWYFTGNLEDRTGRPFGYQLTFFRIGQSPRPVAPDSPWRSNTLYMAHFTVSDITAGRFHSHERLSRGAMGLAGAVPGGLELWLDDWSAGPEPCRRSTGTGAGTSVATGARPLRLCAAEGAVGIDLSLAPGKPPVAQGERGLSRKSAAPGNASFYYSQTRMPTEGVIAVGDVRFAVSGASWMDREWSTSALGPDQIGWDWYALQLSNGQELMFYRLRRRDGGTDPLSAGTIVLEYGGSVPLAAREVEIDTLSFWVSPRGGSRYPARTRLSVPERGLVLEVTPRLPDQELDVSVRYWEGAVEVRGSVRGLPVTGKGYLELTGYADG
jgi:predicted secreted hydrolase